MFNLSCIFSVLFSMTLFDLGKVAFVSVGIVPNKQLCFAPLKVPLISAASRDYDFDFNIADKENQFSGTGD